MAGNSKSVVLAALVANGAIAILKFAGFLLTQSPAMLAETYHSLSDTGNQVFLLIGIRYGSRERDREHPFGYGKAQFFYSFLVSVFLFGIAGWESAKHGYKAVMHGETTAVEGSVTIPVIATEVPGVYVNYGVLLGAIVFETYALIKARAAMQAEIEEKGYSGYVEAFRKTSRTTLLTALTEDTIALAGLGLALGGIFLTRWTGNYIFDASAALLIGIMLMGFALALAWENKRLIIGESLPADEERALRSTIEGVGGVASIVGFRTVYFGPEEILVTADVAFDDGLDTTEIERAVADAEARVREQNPDVVKVYVEPEVRSAD
ncbi:cation diffusion facilitator family transporter [Natronoarchaeum philippinense]|uniref:Cation diffusion facilitator family transporter n=1 Tax=Natronoarchaeum philippinense TaxID=558529 RepID=A0A285NB20_NATPI|nr:cation diffusion facilitator family transporter [Natronoarchaeum philippinense]SNZ06508.1 cation diffusion facilitator family transporter [Natronoarchaeum philippinense]